MFTAQTEASNSNYRKDTVLAIKHRNDGNAKFRQRQFFEALEFYNKSLLCARPNTLEIPLAYANRSAVYLEVKEFQLCLDNIHLAFDSSYPVQKLQKLKDREEQCKKMMKDEVKSEDDDPWKFFKLSYPANEKIPFIAGCLELRTNETFGRHIFTKRDLKPGDIIAIEEPLFFFAFPNNEHTRCVNCLKCNKMSLIPHEFICGVMFCSEECHEKAKNCRCIEKDCRNDFFWRIFAESLEICDGSFEKLQQFLIDPELSKKTIFDFDFNNPDDPLFKFHQLICFNGLQMLQPQYKHGDAFRVLSRFAEELFEDSYKKEVMRNFMVRSYLIAQNSFFGVEWVFASEYTAESKIVAAGIFLFGSLLNHSCIPNIEPQVVDNKFAYIVRQPIAKGQQLFISYGTLFYIQTLETRKKDLKDRYDFDCMCEACVCCYPTIEFSLEDLKQFISGSSIANMKKEHKKNCKIIAANPDKTSKLKIVKLIYRNMFLLSPISMCEPYIFSK